MEADTRLFLIDEDTSATNFMVRDEFMQQVISREKEPITPFLERARDLYEKAGISTILVAGSSGAFFYIADHILMMDHYHPVDITERVKGLCGQHTAPRVQAPGFAIPDFHRILPAFRGGRKGGGGRDWHGRERGQEERHERMKVKSYGLESFSLDKEEVNVRYLEQLLDPEQVTALAYLLRFGLEQALDGKKTVQEAVGLIWGQWEKEGWNPFCSSYIPCGLAKPRLQELFACIDRFRG